MLNFPPAATEHAAQFHADLKGGVKLVQALRGFNCRFSCLLYAYRTLERVQVKAAQTVGSENHDADGMLWYLEETLRERVALDVRAMCDSRTDALAAKTIADGLDDPISRAALCNYLDGIRHSQPRVTDPAKRESYLDYIGKYMAILASKQSRDGSDHALVAKVAIVRRWTNKIIAHITLDDYRVDSQDLHHVFLALATLATAIEFVMGEAAYPGDLQTCEEKAVRGGENLLGMSDARPAQYLRLIRLWLPDWVHSRQEFFHHSHSGIATNVLSH